MLMDRIFFLFVKIAFSTIVLAFPATLIFENAWRWTIPVMIGELAILALLILIDLYVSEIG